MRGIELTEAWTHLIHTLSRPLATQRHMHTGLQHYEMLLFCFYTKHGALQQMRAVTLARTSISNNPHLESSRTYFQAPLSPRHH
jgi:hypothetical protein